MRRHVLAMALGLSACSQSTKPPTPLDRTPVTNGAPPSVDMGTIGNGEDPGTTSPPDGFLVDCCDVTFKLPDADGPGASEVSAVLRGAFYPLNTPDGVALTYANGAWTGVACMPMTYSGIYYYDVVVNDSAGGTYSDYRANPFAPSAVDETLGTVNTFSPVTSCSDASLTLYSTVM
ncbi:MAG: hypothetical protein ABI321_10970 [Polyangia bacterium]